MKKYMLKNLDCAHCASVIEDRLKQMNGVQQVSVNFAAQSMQIETEHMDDVIRLIGEVEPKVKVVSPPSGGTAKTFHLKNLDCAHCAAKIEKKLKDLAEVQDVSIDFATLSMKLQTDNLNLVVDTIKEVDSAIEVIQSDHAVSIDQTSGLKQQLLLLGSCFVAMFGGIMFQEKIQQSAFPIIEYILFIGLYLITGYSVLLKAFKNLLRGQIFDEHFLMSIATLGAIFIHALPEAAGVMIFFRIGEQLEQYAVNKSRRSIRALLAIKPDSAHLKTAEGIKTVSPETVLIGDEIIVKPGERIPLDGTVTSGESQLDTSAITGESVPVQIKDGDAVLAGMICQTGTLVIKVEKEFKDSSISRILEMVENALQRKSKTDRFITVFARYYTPAIVLISTLTALVPPFVFGMGSFSDWLYRALVILVISCPCALVISIPLGYFGGIGRASHEGILIKGSNYLDIIPKISTFIFDKTGTLTKGVFKVTEVCTRNGYKEEDLIRYAAYAEAFSNHPIAGALKAAYPETVQTEKILQHTEKAGFGVKARLQDIDILVGNDKYLHAENIEHQDCKLDRTAVYVVINGEYAGYIIISDEEKPDALSALQNLKSVGIKKLVMLTGDNRHVAEFYKNTLNIDDVYAELLPGEKVDILEKYQSQTPGQVAFVGDGINDAPVIARADIGFAMGQAGTDAAIETADVVLMTDHLSKLPEAIRISKKTKAVVWQNIFFALGIKIIFVVFGAFGMANMWEAVFADVGVTLLAVLNSLRVLKKKTLS